MRKLFRLPQYFLICVALLISSKSFAVCIDSGTAISSPGTYATNIVTCVNDASGIALNNISGTVNMTGNISTEGNLAFGIYLKKSSVSSTTNTVNMTGNISTTGTLTSGIFLWNSYGTNNINTVNMIGNISTTGLWASGIYLYNFYGTNNTNTANMTGNITTSRDGASGIYLDNTYGTNNINTVNMIGNISTSGNTGDISASGVYLYNFYGTNNTNTANMIGNISTTGISASGIFLGNENGTSSTNTVNMTGNITTDGTDALGIYLYNSDTSNNNTNTVNMTGNITTSGNSAYGISLYNVSGSYNTNTVNMTGNISTSRASGYGIYSNTNGSFITNTVNIAGNITTNGNSADAIFLTTSGTNNINTVNMTGNISTSHPTAYGINLFIESGTSNSNTVNMTGRIAATDASGYAISSYTSGSTNSNIVQLNKGSSVIGGIYGGGNFPANNFLKLNLGAGASYSFATTGFTVTDLNGRPMVTGSAHAAGIGNVSTASQSLYERTSQITQSLDDRVRTYDLGQNTDQPFWINTYYSDSSRGGQGLSGSNLSFNQYRSGITAGFNVKNSYTPTELIVNYEHGKLNIDEGNQGISSNSVMAGALFPDIKKLFNGTLSAKALVGYSDFSGDRKVLTNDVAFSGSRNVTANYQSSHLTIGSAWTKTLYQTDKMILDTLVGVDLNTQHINSYSESDLFKWNGRTINQLQERVSLGMEIKPMVNPLTLYGRVGIERRDLLSGENQNFAINNTAVSYNDSNQRNTYATLNAGAYYPLTATIKAYAQVRYYDSDKNIDSLSGSIGISGQF